MSAPPPHLSVVIPAFNEASRLPAYLDEVIGFLEGRGELEGVARARAFR